MGDVFPTAKKWFQFLFRKNGFPLFFLLCMDVSYCLVGTSLVSGTAHCLQSVNFAWMFAAVRASFCLISALKCSNASFFSASVALRRELHELASDIMVGVVLLLGRTISILYSEK